MGLQSGKIILHDDSGILRRRKVGCPPGGGILSSFKTILHDDSALLHLGRICLRCRRVCLRDHRVVLHDERASRSSCRDRLQSHNPTLHRRRDALQSHNASLHRRRDRLHCHNRSLHRRSDRLQGDNPSLHECRESLRCDGEAPSSHGDEGIFHHRSLHERRQTPHPFLTMATWNRSALRGRKRTFFPTGKGGM